VRSPREGCEQVSWQLRKFEDGRARIEDRGSPGEDQWPPSGRSATRLSGPVAHDTVTPSHPRCRFTPDRTGGNLLLDRPDGHHPCSTRFLYRSSSVVTASSANWAAAGWGRSTWHRTPSWAARSPSKCPTSPRPTPLPSTASD